MWRGKLRIRPAAWVLLAAFVVLAPLPMVAAIFLSAACHEAAHIVVLRAVKGTVKEITFTAFGAEIRMSGPMGYGAELLVTLAGPVANLVLAVLFAAVGRVWETGYLFAGAQAVLGLFNLLPVRPLDGERVLWIVSAWFLGPYTADKLCAWTGLAVSVSAVVLALTAFCRLGGTPFFLWGALGLLWSAMGEMGLVNGGEKG